MTRAEREAKRDAIAIHLQLAAQLLAELVGDYTEEQDGKFSACHPRMGMASTLGQIEKLEKVVRRGKV